MMTDKIKNRECKNIMSLNLNKLQNGDVLYLISCGNLKNIVINDADSINDIFNKLKKYSVEKLTYKYFSIDIYKPDEPITYWFKDEFIENPAANFELLKIDEKNVKEYIPYLFYSKEEAEAYRDELNEKHGYIT